MIDHLIIQLTYPKFHFKTETEVDSLTGLQRYEGDHKFYLGNNFQLEMRLRFFQQVWRSIYAIRDMSVLLKILVPNENTTLRLTRSKEHQNSTDSKFAHGWQLPKKARDSNHNGKLLAIVI